MARSSSLSSLVLLSILFGAVIVSSFDITDDYYASLMKRAGSKIDAKNFPMSFGKRSAPLPAGLDRMAYRMNFGKRAAAPTPAADDNEYFEEAKRMDKTMFRVGFGRR
ncbi:hypothetical protein PENTCL1PPCAC_28900 [Pristionchus entomophagus]|uniref:Uncharacterized protein n=1 Tax=Pristionchus entomophagus TaxID=358040 RepID=A0AAV5UJT6_9BILA|nr:hypothetical protein PENTCL1PPCAC_28900 [Pristionchus entomophagus]